jgi:hypothetical protein
MTRQRKIDPAELEREYVFGTESLAELAARHGLSKSAVAGYAARGGWAEKRAAFTTSVQDRIREALASDWVAYEAQLRQKMVETSVRSLARYMQALDAGEIDISSRDAIAWIGLLRQLLDELRPKEEQREPELEIDPETAARIVAQVDALLA